MHTNTSLTDLIPRVRSGICAASRARDPVAFRACVASVRAVMREIAGPARAAVLDSSALDTCARLASPSPSTGEAPLLNSEKEPAETKVAFVSDVLDSWFALSGYFHDETLLSAPWHCEAKSPAALLIASLPEPPRSLDLSDAFFFENMMCEKECAACARMRVDDTTADNLIAAARTRYLSTLGAEKSAAEHAAVSAALNAALQARCETRILTKDGSSSTAAGDEIGSIVAESGGHCSLGEDDLIHKSGVCQDSGKNKKNNVSLVFDETKSDDERTAALAALSDADRAEAICTLASEVQVAQTARARRFLRAVCFSPSVPAAARYAASRSLFAAELFLQSATGNDDDEDESDKNDKNEKNDWDAKRMWRAALASILADEKGNSTIVLNIARDVFESFKETETKQPRLSRAGQETEKRNENDAEDARTSRLAADCAAAAAIFVAGSCEGGSERAYRAVLGLRSVCDAPRGLRSHYDSILATLVAARGVHVRYRILAAQHLLAGAFRDHTADAGKRGAVFAWLSAAATNARFPACVRSDAADVILSNENKEDDKAMTAAHRQVAERAIAELARSGQNGQNGQNGKMSVYDDRQNVHRVLGDAAPNDSFRDIIVWLRAECPPVKWDAAKIREFCLAGVDDANERDAISGALTRVELDRQIHDAGGLCVTNAELLRRIVAYAAGLTKKDKKKESGMRDEDVCFRMRQELADADGWCSRGYVARLANVMSGREGLSLRVSTDDAVYASVSARFSALLAACCADAEAGAAAGAEAGAEHSKSTVLAEFCQKMTPGERAAVERADAREKGETVAGGDILDKTRRTGARAMDEYISDADDSPSSRPNLRVMLFVFYTATEREFASEFGDRHDWRASLRSAFARLGV